MRVQWWVCWLMLAAAARADVGERLTMAVSPAQSFAPTTLTVRVHLKPDAENRALEVVAESGDYSRSNRIQLDGNEAPDTNVVELPALPGGDDGIRRALIDGSGRARALVRKQVIVIGSATSHHENRSKALMKGRQCSSGQ
jgi:hypothetical protein